MKQSTFYYLLRRGLFGGGISPTVRAFQTRVINDGGIIEKIQCVSKAISQMPSADPGRVSFDAFNLRVVADGGQTEGRTCTINAINSLL